MNNNNMWNVSTQQIQIFLKAVEFKNFTKVANHFNYTPSMVSKTIAALEDELNIKLFIRKPHELTPTPAARLLADEWRQLVGAINNSIIKAHSFQNKPLTKIYLGFVDSSSKIDQLISQSIFEYKSINPQVTVIAEKHDMHRAVELLNNNMLDIVITSAIEIPYLEDHNLAWEKIYDTNVSIYVPRGNNLFTKNTLEFSDLKDEELMALDFTMHPSYKSWLYDICSKYGFTPNITSTYRTVRSLVFNLKINDIIFIGDTITSDWCDENLKQFILPDKSFTLASWRKESNKDVIHFKDYLKAIYADLQLKGV